MWQNLIDVLGKICVIYDKLADIEERKHNALVAIDMDSLAKILDEEQLTASKIQNLEKKRGSVYKQLADTVKVNDDIKAEDFYKYAPSLAIEKRLITLHKQLSKSVDRAIKLRDNNQILANAALEAVKFHLNRLSNATKQSYSATGADIVSHQKNYDFKA